MYARPVLESVARITYYPNVLYQAKRVLRCFRPAKLADAKHDVLLRKECCELPTAWRCVERLPLSRR